MGLDKLNIHMEENEAFRQSIKETVKNDVQKSINQLHRL